MKNNFKYNENSIRLLPIKDNSNNISLLPNNVCLLPQNDNAIKNISKNNYIDEETINVIQEDAPDNFEFIISVSDTLFTLTPGNNVNNNNIRNIISKIIIIKELSYINLHQLSEALDVMKIKELNIFSIDFSNNCESNIINVFNVNRGSKVVYTEIAKKHFIKFINTENNDFLNYNKNSLYIAKGSNYISIKNLFTTINDCQVNLCRGGSQKSHALSPLDFRLSCYLIAMFNFDYKLINDLNTFNFMGKDRYLSYVDKYNKSRY